MEGVLIALVVAVVSVLAAVKAQQFSLVHTYAHLDGAPGKNSGRGASLEHTALLTAHDRRRLATLFALDGSADHYYSNAGLYYTAITIGTPPKQYHVAVDTGSNRLWLNCAPCSPNCALSSNVTGIALQLYDPALSSTDTVLGCNETYCITASYGQPGQCTVSPPGACAYSVRYADTKSTEGYIINDVMTFQYSPTTTTTASIYFGCGTNQSQGLGDPKSALDGTMGFSQVAISVPSQLATQGKIGKTFAHCLPGDPVGVGNLVIGNITEPGITYNPQVPGQYPYNVGKQNIGVNGVNITDPSSFTVTDNNAGVSVDSGSTKAAMVEPAYSQFVAAIKAGAPVPSI